MPELTLNPLRQRFLKHFPLVLSKPARSLRILSSRSSRLEKARATGFSSVIAGANPLLLR